MCALMGPSGVGKTTLLDVIADRKVNGHMTGEVLVNHLPRSPYFHLESAYVLQDDVHMATLTVEETVRYSAWVLLPEGSSSSVVDARVKVLLELMNLTSCKDTLVGDSLTKGLSGGQMKRLSIAVNIAGLPTLVFLDGMLRLM